MNAVAFGDAGYRYIPGPFQYSAGVAALPGFRLERVRFLNPVPLDQGFSRIEAMMSELGVKPTAFCACELRSPAPFTEQGFIDFNRVYVGTLERWGIFRNEENPVARSNVCPEIAPPPVPSFHAFTLALPASGPDTRTFVIAGSGEAQEGSGPYSEKTVRYRDTSPEGIREKAVHVLGTMEARMGAFGYGWADTTAAQLYTVHDPHPFMGDELVRRGAARHGLTWHYNRPPVVDLEYEMDCRRVFEERVVEG